jgi:hypothetical protein
MTPGSADLRDSAEAGGWHCGTRSSPASCKGGRVAPRGLEAHCSPTAAWRPECGAARPQGLRLSDGGAEAGAWWRATPRPILSGSTSPLVVPFSPASSGGRARRAVPPALSLPPRPRPGPFSLPLFFHLRARACMVGGGEARACLRPCT